MEPEPKPDEMAPLLEALHKGSGNDRRAAVAALSALGPRAEPAATALLERLRDCDLSLREAAADALARIGRPAVAALLGALRTKDPDFQKAVVVTLAKMGPEAVDAVPALSELIEDEWLGFWAVRALQRIQDGQRADMLRWLRIRPAWVLLGAATFGFLLSGIAIWLWAREASLPAPPRAAVTTGLSLAFVGLSLGSVLAFHREEGRRGVLLTILLGIGGGMVGLLLGGLFATVVEPIVQVLGR